MAFGRTPRDSPLNAATAWLLALLDGVLPAQWRAVKAWSGLLNPVRIEWVSEPDPVRR